jgi:diguanylate cyclase (GGDEF)-like protein
MSAFSRVGGLAWGGFAVTILVLGVVFFSANASARRSAELAETSSQLTAAFLRADEAAASAAARRREYRFNHGPGTRAAYREQGQALATALDEIDHTGQPTDRRLVADLRAAIASYDVAVMRMFDAVDAGDMTQAERIDVTEVRPAYAEIDEWIEVGAFDNAAVSESAAADLSRLEASMFFAIAAGLAVGVALLITFAIILTRYHRALLQQVSKSEHQAMHDSLTGLPNRPLFTDRLESALAATRRNGSSLAVMLLDLDRFKEVNDTLGHHYGDLLLTSVAERLAGALREVDTVARLSGDEFAVLLPGADAEATAEVGERVLRILHQSFVLDDVTVDIEASIGIAIAPEHASTAEEIVRFADLAMYAAKDSKTGVVMYEPATLVHQPSRLLLLGELRRALEQPDEIVLHYQPKVDLNLNELCGVEALVRWTHPTRGPVTPAEFIPMAESTGLINRLTAHVLRLAIRQARHWLDDGFEVPVAVNLSPRCLLDTTLLDRVRDLLRAYDLPANLLRLEVTESAIIANPALALQTLTGLHDIGVRLSIDDYGTGYSSMAYLKRLPVDELKVDRSFVMNMTNNDNDAILVRSAIDLGHNLGLSVVAEGVERSDHVAALNELGCDIAQGYHYARPMPPDEISSWIKSHAGDPTGAVPASSGRP